jgi:hypothetical protein
VIDNVVTFGAGHFYISQSDKGGLVFGGDIDGYNSYAQRGNLPMVEHVIECGLAMIPSLSRARVLRAWGGIMDMSMDGSPIIDRTPVDNLYLNCGWCYGGFKATPASGWCFAHTIATGRAARAELRRMRLDRFRTGYVMDETGPRRAGKPALRNSGRKTDFSWNCFEGRRRWLTDQLPALRQRAQRMSSTSRVMRRRPAHGHRR